MLTTNFTVKTLKDVSAEDFIAAYSKHLKTQGKFEIPKVWLRISIYIFIYLSGLTLSRPLPSRS